MSARAIIGLLLVAIAAALPAQERTEEEPLWMPEDYRLLSFEERKAMPADEMKEIGTRNTTLLKEAIQAMTPEERQEVSVHLNEFGQTHELADYERQYVTIVSMMLLSAGIQERLLADRATVQTRFEKLLRDQEETTRGFPPDPEPVMAEADAIEAQFGKADSQALYLRALKPLRARPWNDAIRVCFRKIVRGNSFPNSQKTSLYDAALVFLQAREKESPDEGAWYSLEAFLRLSMRNEVSEAKRLFAIAIQKKSRDLESITVPILLAEADGNAAEVERLMPRAREAWPKPEDLDRVLWDDLVVLPQELQVRAREAFGGKYKKAHPADWSSRAEILVASLARGGFREVESETLALLALPLATLPEPHRSEFETLRLQAIAGEGRCDEAVAEIPRLEADARAAYRGNYDGENPPAPRDVRDVQDLRAQLREGRRGLSRLRAAIADGSVETAPELTDAPGPKRREQAQSWANALEEELKQEESVLASGNDDAIAANWSRRELAAWFEIHHMMKNAYYDLADRGTRLAILVRSAAGKCLLAHHRAAEAARVLASCVGDGQNYHGDCGEPILEAGRELLKEGRLKDAAAVYAVTAPVRNFASPADDLFLAIEKAAPGTVRRIELPPLPTPDVAITPRAEP